MTPKELIQKYYESLNNKDDSWKELWADDAIFSDASKALVAKGREEIIQSFNTFLKGVEKIEVKQLIGEGEHICAIVSYEYVNPKGEKMTQDDAEVWMVQDGRLAQMTLYFDLTAYRTFIRS